MLLAEEYFANENPLFLETLRLMAQPQPLAALTDRWKTDPRPWARDQIFAYLSQPLDCSGHQPIVKRLFKQAEENKDHDLMGAFLLAFDWQVRRKLQVKRRWDFRARTATEEERLVTQRNVLPLKFKWQGRNPATGAAMSVPVRAPRDARLFKYRTRYYLRRRAWRYFRRLGHRDPAAYVVATGPRGLPQGACTSPALSNLRASPGWPKSSASHTPVTPTISRSAPTARRSPRPPTCSRASGTSLRARASW
jgi:hypothetical protein